MKTVWKFPLKVEDSQTLMMPSGAQILSVQQQFGQPCLWALVDPDAPKEGRFLEIFGTGHPIPDIQHTPSGVKNSRVFLATFQIAGGSLVFHLFERLDKRADIVDAEEVATPPRLPDAQKDRD